MEKNKIIPPAGRAVRDEKREVRRRILERRDALPARDRARLDFLIGENLLGTAVYCRAEAVLAYAGYRSEVATAALIERALADGKIVFVPKVSGMEMEFWRITEAAALAEGYKGIPEPAESVSFPEWMAGRNHAGDPRGAESCPAMMWMPGAAFDRERHRIGYGKGFYDRYLDKLRDSAGLRLTTAALAYGCQVLERIPSEPHDVRPDMLITEAGIVP